MTTNLSTVAAARRLNGNEANGSNFHAVAEYRIYFDCVPQEPLHPLDYEPGQLNPNELPRRPLWRNYIAAWLLISAGFLIADTASSPQRNHTAQIIGFVISLFGLFVFAAAIGHSLWFALSYLDCDQTPPRTATFALVLAGFLICILHCAVQFVLYRQRILDKGGGYNSDLHIFAIPSLLALAAYALVFSRWAMNKPWKPHHKVLLISSLTLVTGFLSFWASVLIPFNVYGT